MSLHKHIAIFLLFSPCIFGHCITYTFEHNYYDVFTSSLGICIGMNFWQLRNYSYVGVQSPNYRSEKFITPLAQLSCVSSFIFEMHAGGVVEANVYMDTSTLTDQIAVFAHQLVSGANDVVVGVVSKSAVDPNYANGWSSLRITLVGSGSYNGYISIMGSASGNSMVLVDSFRYISPGVDENSCLIYEEDNIIQTTSPPATEQNVSCTVAPISPSDLVCDCQLLEFIVLGLVSFIVISFVSSCCYCIGKRRGKRIQQRANTGS